MNVWTVVPDFVNDPGAFLDSDFGSIRDGSRNLDSHPPARTHHDYHPPGRGEPPERGQEYGTEVARGQGRRSWQRAEARAVGRRGGVAGGDLGGGGAADGAVARRLHAGDGGTPLAVRADDREHGGGGPLPCGGARG